MGEEDKQEEKEDRTIYLIMLILESINLYAESETLTKIALTIIILVLDEGLMMKRIIDWCMEIRMKDLRSGIFMTLLSYTKAEEEKQEENVMRWKKETEEEDIRPM